MIVSIEQLNEGSEGFVPPSVTGTIGGITEAKSGGDGDREWKLQSAYLNHDGERIKLTLSKREDLTSELNGKTVVIKCRSNDKGLYGMKLKRDTFNGQTSNVLWVYKGAEMVVDSAGFGDDGNDPELEQKLEEGGIAKVEVTKQEEAPKTSVAKRDLHKMAQGMLLCYKASLWVSSQLEDEYEMTDAQIQAMASSFFIKGDRDGILAKLAKETK